jgi:hypothetical protein
MLSTKISPSAFITIFATLALVIILSSFAITTASAQMNTTDSNMTGGGNMTTSGNLTEGNVTSSTIEDEDTTASQ